MPIITKKQMHDLKQVHAVQGQKGNWDYSHYMCGLFNGLELALAIIQDREPKYREISKPEPTSVFRKLANKLKGVKNVKNS